MVNLSGPAATQVAPAPPVASAPLAGTLGDFRILREVGRGGMGVVYEAEQISLGRRVALKVLPFAAVLDPRHLRRFQNEARAAACLHHPNIVPVYNVASDRGVHYYAMQFIEGQTLAALIQERRRQEGFEGGGPRAEGRPSRGGHAASTLADRNASATSRRDPRSSIVSSRAAALEVARLGVQAAEALDHAHQQGVVHRDVKPANLMLDHEGRLWVTDFGLAHIQGDGGLTATGDLLGTLRYMSPEQALARRGLVDHRADIYSLGVTLYELLTLRPAFPGDDRQELLHRIAHEDPVPLRRLNPAVPVDLETVLARAMAKEPAERYASARELADDLRRFLDDRPVLARRPTLARRLSRWARRHRALAVSGILSAAILLIGGILVLAGYAAQQHQLAVQRDADARENGKKKQEAEEQRRQAEAKLYRALLAQAAALRRERQPGYRREVWDSLREAGRLKVATDGGAAIRAEVLACLGDPIGLDPVRPSTVVRRKPPEMPEAFRKAFEKLQEGWPVRLQQKWSDVMARPWAVGPGGRYFAHLLKSGVMWIWSRGNDLKPADPRPYRILRITFPDGNNLGQGETLPLGHVHDLKFTPDGTGLVVGCEEGIVLLGLFPEVRVVSSFRVGVTSSIDVHPGGRLMVTGGRQANLWSLTNHRLIASFPAPMGARVEFSADGKHLLAVLAGRAVAAWPVSHTAEKRCLDSHVGGIPSVAFSPDGKLLASASKDRTVRIWDAASGRLLQTCRSHKHQIEAVAFSPDGKLLASGDVSGGICLWAPSTGRRVAAVTGSPAISPGQIWRLQFGPGGSHLIAGGVRGVAAWDLRDGPTLGGRRLIATPLGQTSPFVVDMAVHPDRPEVVFLERGGRLHCWTVGEDTEPRELPCKIRSELRTLHFDRAGKRLTCLTPHGTLGVLDWPGAAVRDTRLEAVFHLALSPDGRWVATASADHEIVVYDINAGREALRLPSERSDVWSLAWSSEGCLAAGLSDGGLVVWDLEQVRARLREFGLPEL
jgi:serine/threonine protein kinase/WD40 repeat protein